MISSDLTTKKAGKVLVINADPEIIRILEVNLTHANLEVVSTTSSAEALQKIHKEKSDIVILDTALPDMEWDEVYRQIKETASDIPVILLSTKAKKRILATKAQDITIRYISKPFDPKEVVALVQGYLMHKERTVNIDPLTGLPNRLQINKEIARLITGKTNFAFIYITMHDIKAVNRVYGYIQGDRVIHLLADIVSEAVRLFGNPDDLVGHFRGDKFVVVSTPWKARMLCRRIIADYNRRIKTLFTEEHLQTGHAPLESPPDSQVQAPNMSIHIAVVTNQKRTFHHYLEVTEYAAEQIEYLKSSPESNCYFDLKVNGIEPSLTSARRELAAVNKEELRAMQGVLAWLGFLTGELEIPLSKMKDCLSSLESVKAERLSQEQQSSFKSLQDSYDHLARVVASVANLAKAEGFKAGILFDEVDISDTLHWVMEQMQEMAEQRHIKTSIEVAKDIGLVLGDKRSLSQSLLYVVRNEIRSAPPGSQLRIHLAEKNEEYIYIEITNTEHYIPAQVLKDLLQGKPDTTQQEAFKNELYPARVLVRGLGGKLEITSGKGIGTTYQVTIPKKWQSWMSEVNALQLAMDISRKEARDALKNIQRSVLSLVEEIPPAMKDTYEKLSGKIQELAVLCNRSLFLADDLNNRLETQQDRLSQQVSEHLTTSEAILTICRDMTRSTNVKYLFNLERAKQVVKYALAIAREFRISDNERLALYHASLLKDIALAFSPHETMAQMSLTDEEDEKTEEVLKEHLNLVWKALSTIPFFLPVCHLLLYRYEKYDGTGVKFGIKGTDIPLGSRILAVADTFDYLSSAQPPQGKLAPKQAVQKIMEDSGRSFDPHIVDAFVTLWKRKELELAVDGNER
jgi:diguanylate cyclase (GGDEF)-like protein